MCAECPSSISQGHHHAIFSRACVTVSVHLCVCMCMCVCVYMCVCSLTRRHHCGEVLWPSRPELSQPCVYLSLHVSVSRALRCSMTASAPSFCPCVSQCAGDGGGGGGHVCTCIHVDMQVCIYICMHVCRYVRTYVCMYVCMYGRMHICIHVCIYASCDLLSNYERREHKFPNNLDGIPGQRVDN